MTVLQRYVQKLLQSNNQHFDYTEDLYSNVFSTTSETNRCTASLYKANGFMCEVHLIKIFLQKPAEFDQTCVIPNNDYIILTSW